MGVRRFAHWSGFGRPIGPRVTPVWLTGDFALALGGALVALAVSWILGFPRLAEPGIDNDSVMRLVQVRDLLAGQGWFDLHQYRMGPQGGFVMHWSRLVDAPIAALILLFRPFLGHSGAEFAAAVIWPTMLMTMMLLALIRAATAFGGEVARFPALVLGTTTCHFLGTFAPGALDHHNLQLVLVVATAAWLIGARSFRTGAAAGAAAGASMAIGMETMPYVVAAGASVAFLFWLRGERQAPLAGGFGTGFAGIAGLCLAVTVRPGEWFSATCDAFSGAHAGSALIGGLGLAACAAATAKSGGVTRLAALAALAAASAVFLLLVYPQCLAEPYGDVAPRLREYWFSAISEAQSLVGLLFQEPASVGLYYATPLIAAILILWRLMRSGIEDNVLPVAVLLVMAIAVSVWQVRAAIFSVSLAAIPLSAWIGALRDRAAATPSAAATLKMAGAWLVSLNVVWSVAGVLVFNDRGSENAEAKACHAAADYDDLARLPDGTVLAASNHGPSILAFTRHRALAGLYHRSEEANLAMIDAMTGNPDEALEVARRYDVDYIAVCPGNPETRILAESALDGLLATIERDEPVDWLRPVAVSEDAAFELFRVVGR